MTLDPGRLLAFAAAVCEAAGMQAEEALLAADTLVQADLWGHQSHGVMRLPWYAARLKSGVAAARASPEAIVDAGAVSVVDGKDAMGQVVAAHAAKEAVRRAKVHGVGVVSVRNSNHFGTAMYFTRMAALEGCVGFLATNASPAMAPWGGREIAVGFVGLSDGMVTSESAAQSQRTKMYRQTDHVGVIEDPQLLADMIAELANAFVAN